MTIEIVVAHDKNRVIGNEGEIPWKRRYEDMTHFRRLTTGHAVLMGRKTWESIPERFKPLEQRKNIIVSKTPINFDFERKIDFDKVCARTCLYDVLSEWKKHNNENRLFIIGGQSIYEQSLGIDNYDESAHKIVDTIHVSLIDGEHDGDTFFPVLPICWRPVKCEAYDTFTYIKYERKK